VTSVQANAANALVYNDFACFSCAGSEGTGVVLLAYFTEVSATQAVMLWFPGTAKYHDPGVKHGSITVPVVGHRLRYLSAPVQRV